MGDALGVKELVLSSWVSWERGRRRRERTGTFFCVITTDESTPRMAMVVWPAPEIALKAYSVPRESVSSPPST